MNKSRFKSMTKKRTIILVLALAAVIAVIMLLVHSCGARSDGEGDVESSEIMTATAERMTITKQVSSPGEIKSALEEKQTPHAGFYLEKIIVSEGQAVSEGNTILTYTNGQAMTAPYDCVVLDWELPDAKQKLTNDHCVNIAGTDVLMIELSVKEDEVLLIKKGNPATITVEATDHKYTGEVSYISDIGDYEEGMSTFKVNVLFNNDGSLKLGMNGKASITLAKAKDVIGIPAGAVTEDSDSSYVLVQRGDNPEDTEQIEVETGISDGKNIEIKSGLEEGDVVQYTSYGDEEGWDEEYEEEYMY